jgi:hypothetical protein
MSDNIIVQGADRTAVSLSWDWFGPDLFVRIYNENASIVAVALASCPQSRSYASGELLSLESPGEGSLVVNAAIRIAGAIKRSVCVVGCIHVGEITRTELELVLGNVDSVVKFLIDRLRLPAEER